MTLVMMRGGWEIGHPATSQLFFSVRKIPFFLLGNQTVTSRCKSNGRHLPPFGKNWTLPPDLQIDIPAFYQISLGGQLDERIRKLCLFGVDEKRILCISVVPLRTSSSMAAGAAATLEVSSGPSVFFFLQKCSIFKNSRAKKNCFWCFLESD